MLDADKEGLSREEIVQPDEVEATKPEECIHEGAAPEEKVEDAQKAAEEATQKAEQDAAILIPGVKILRDEATDDGGYIMELTSVDIDKSEFLTAEEVRSAAWARVRKTNPALGFNKDYLDQRDFGHTKVVDGVEHKVNALVRVLVFRSTML